MITMYTRIAQGGTGLIITGVAAVSRDGSMGPGMNSIFDDRYVSGFVDLADSVHAAGAKLAVHLMHGGMEAFPFYVKRKRLVSSSSGIFGPNQIRFKGMDVTRTTMAATAMTIEEIQEVGDDFAAAACRAKEAGADAVEINGAQGFLLQQFYSPYFNKRTDYYGGTLENRMRFPQEVVGKIRSMVGPDFPIIFRMVATEGEGGGIEVEEAQAIAGILEQAGVDALHVTAGRGVAPAVWTLMMPIAEDGHAPIIDHIAAIKEAVNIPVIGVQRIVHPGTAEDILESGKADMVAMGRALIADPDWVKKAAAGRDEDIRKCIGCLQGCIGTQMTAGFANCLQNPEFGREKQMQVKKTEKPKKVLVIGGGPAGLEAALIAGLRGHEVILCDREATLGGQWNLASVPPGKADYSWVVDWRVGQIAKLSNVSVRLGCNVTPEIVKTISPDVAVVATGSVPVIPAIFRAVGNKVITANDVLCGKKIPGECVAVIGGGATGCETANYLGSTGRKVTLIEALSEIGKGEEPARKVWLMKSLSKNGVKIETNAPVAEISDSGELFVLREGRRESVGVFDTVVAAAGVQCYDPLSEIIKGIAVEVYVIGDAYVMPTNGLDALHHAAEIARII
jgi:2,4-dienoyl-CoA reductase-like NADH-dependent reductase (Old Yellow Enzyme family)/thioredoxin reductase